MNLHWKKSRRSSRSRRRRSRQAAPPPSGLSRPLLAGLLLLAGLVGAAGGAWVMHRRAQAQEVLVSVNGDVIRRADYEARLDAATGGAVLRRMVQEDLQTQYARQKGLLPSDGAVQAQYAQLVAQPGFTQRASEIGLTPAALRRTVQADLAGQALTAGGAVPTEAQVQDFYRRNADPADPQARYVTPETVTDAVIVTPTQPESRQARARLDAGVPFADVARQDSHDVSRTVGGVLPPVVRGRTRAVRVPGLEAALFALAPGQTAGPTQIGGVWWIIRCQRRTPATVRPFAAVQADCRAAVAAQLGRARSGAGTDADFARFAQAAAIRVFDPRCAPLLHPAAAGTPLSETP